MSIERDQVRRFYVQIWEGRNIDAMSDILHENIVFRGSLGNETKGHAGFIEYLNRVHEALAEYKCDIEDIITEPKKAFAKMKFSGIHVGDLMGYKPSGRHVYWPGAALFIFNGVKIVDIWVLGDLKVLEQQLQVAE